MKVIACRKLKWRTKIALFFALISGLCIDVHAKNTDLVLHPITNNLYYIEGVGGNVSVLTGNDGIIIVDDQYAANAHKLLESIREISSGDVKFVLNTHWHQDHTGGNEFFSGLSTIVSHENVRKRLSKDQFMSFFNKEVPATDENALPIITFKEKMEFFFNDEQIEFLHYPKGHTDGDGVVFYKKANAVHMGDLYFNGTFPFIDLDSGGSVRGVIRNVQRVLDRVDEDVKVIPGHGSLATKEDLIAYHGMLVEASGLVREAIQKNMSSKQIQEENFLGDRWDAFESSFMSKNKWIEILYKDLSGEGP